MMAARFVHLLTFACGMLLSARTVHQQQQHGQDVSMLAGSFNQVHGYGFPMIPMEGRFTESKFEYDPRPGAEFSSTTLIDLLEAAARAHPNDAAFQKPRQDGAGDLAGGRNRFFSLRRGRPYTKYTWKEYRDLVMVAASAYIARGLKPMDTVNIRGINSPEWLIAFLGCIAAGGLPVGIYPTDTPETLEFKARESAASFIVVGSAEDAKIYQQFVGRVPTLKAMITWDTEAPRDALPGPFLEGPNRPRFLSWSEFVAENYGDGVRYERIKSIKPGQAAAVVYTSGATGQPKGAMLSHDALTWAASVIDSSLLKNTPLGGRHRIFSHTPLSHVAGLVYDVVWPLYATQLGGTRVTAFFPARCYAEKRCVPRQLTDARPTVFVGTPEVWEGLRVRMDPARRAGVFNKSSSARGLGLDKVKAAVNVGGPILKGTHWFFHRAGIKILDVFGQSESAALGTAWTPEDFARCNLTETFGSIGKPVGNEFQISAGGGEIMLRGRNVMLGYLNALDETRSSFAEDGWLRTGVVAESESRGGFVFPLGRASELMRSAMSEEVRPAVVEQGIREACNGDGNIVKEVVVFGDGAYYLSALLTLYEDVKGGIPTGELIGAAASVDTAKTVAEAQVSNMWSFHLGRCISRYNDENSTDSSAKVWRFAVVPGITPESAPDLMAPLHQVKRRGVARKYADLLRICGGDAPLRPMAGPSPCIPPRGGLSFEVV